MRCERWRSLLIERLAGELSGGEAAGLERHLEECPACAEEEARLRLAVAAAAPPLPQTGDLGAMESRLVGEMRRWKEAPEAGGAQPREPARAKRGDGAPGFLSLFFRAPIPSYAVLMLVIVAVAGGFWMGRAQRGERTEGAAVTRPVRASYPAADTLEAPSRPRVSGGGGETPHGAPSWAQFTSAPTDGIAQAASQPADTL